MLLTWPQIAELSFPDELVERWDFQPTENRLSIRMTGCYFDVEGWGQILSPVELKIGPWTHFSGNRYWRSSTFMPLADASEPLKEICECEFREGFVSLHGFGTLCGEWIQYQLYGPAFADLLDPAGHA